MHSVLSALEAVCPEIACELCNRVLAVQAAADGLQENYDKAWAGAQDTHRAANQMLDLLTKVRLWLTSLHGAIVLACTPVLLALQCQPSCLQGSDCPGKLLST